MRNIDLEFALTKILSEAQQAKFENKILRVLLIEKGILAEEEFESRYPQIKSEMTENYISEELGISVEELRELVIGN